MSESKIIASEQSHYYTRDGKPCYEVPCTTKEGMRPTNIKDARKLDLVPSFTLIKDQISKPGLELWKLNQLLAAALTLPRLDNEPPDDFARRVVNDYKQEGQKAAERGKDLHAAIELWMQNKNRLTYRDHCIKIQQSLLPFGIDIFSGDWSVEHSFASELGYGGKIDAYYDSGVIIDFKTKQSIDDKKQLVWDEHPMQCAAYGYGVFKAYVNADHAGWDMAGEVEKTKWLSENRTKFRGLNVFIGVDDCEVRVFEHSWEDLTRGWEMFRSLLRYWQVKNDWKTT